MDSAGITALKEVVAYRDLLYMLTWREIRIKYKQTILGFMWALLMPLILVGSGILMRYAFATLSGAHVVSRDVATIGVKALPWAFFVSSIRFASASLISNTNLVTKIYFPKVIFPISAVFSQMVDLGLSAMALVVVLIALNVGLSWNLLWVPCLLVILVLLVSGLGILLSAANLFFRDVKYIVEVVLTFAIFFTPVLYDVSMFGPRGRFLLLNPVAPILEGLNQCIVLHRSPSLAWVAYSGLVSIFVFAFASRMFLALEPRFAESI
jgi:ABC-type polysaccharide/polyol phosphate export permease